MRQRETPTVKTHHLLTLLLTAALPGFAAETAVRPNIILVMADDQGWGDTC